MDRELRVIDRALEVDGTPVRVLGLRLDESGTVYLEMVIDLSARNRFAEEVMRSDRAASIQHPATNREEGRNRIEFDSRQPLTDTWTVEVGGVCFEVSGGSGDCWRPDRTALTVICLEHGWVPPAKEDLWCWDMEMRGTFETLPETDSPLRFIRRPKERKILAETPVTLTVGEGVQHIEDGDGRWVNVLEVGVTDIWALWEQYEMDDRRRAQREAACPRGMGWPTLVYECPEDLTPKFCTADWLTEEPKRNSGMGLIFQVPKERGPTGLPLRPASIEGVVPLDAKTIEMELFSWEKKEPQPDILL